ncbi:IS66 family transposase [Psychroflexus sp. MBR-150]
MEKDKLIESLLQKVEELSKKLIALELENSQLKARLAKYETPKNSNNSSIPPSKDENRPKRKSLRIKTGRKPGGQTGRKGNTLKMVEIPDVTEEHIPDYCNCCGNDLSSLPHQYAGSRQVFDIPEIKIKVTEHKVYKKVCPCGCETKSDYPSQANAPVSYGNNIESLIGYFHTRQYLPFKRMQEMFNTVFNIPISEGGIHYLLNKLVTKAEPAYNLIKQEIANSKSPIGSDETGVKVSGDKNWAWTWQNEKATFITITDNRGQKSIEQTFENGFENAVLVHDCWKSHFNTNAQSHQICMAHLLRDLNYLTEKYDHKWSRACKNLFLKAINFKKNIKDIAFNKDCPIKKSIEKRMDIILNHDPPKEHKELITFKKRLIKYRNYIFTFLYHLDVPPDNNASERAIRNIKVKQKISGQFRSEQGCDNFAILRSVTDSCLKNQQSVLSTLNIIANLRTD